MKYETPEQFVDALKIPALTIEQKYKVPQLFTIAQAALESGWGKSAIGNNLFGIKAGKSWTGLKQLIKTTEYHDNPNVKYPEVISIVPFGSKYKYTVRDYFRDYISIEECLLDHANFLIVNKRYSAAFNYTDPKEFAKEVAKAGYATAPNYAEQLCSMIDSVKKRLH
jgi:flagellar protein FlgJ